MGWQHRDIWNAVPIYVEKFLKKFAKASPQEQRDELRKWFDPRRGVIRRLVNKPILAEAASSNLRLIFVEVLGDKILDAAKQCR
jgi:hypothetical protein